MRSKFWYRLLIWFLLITSLSLLLYLSPTLINPKNLAADDFGHFWAAGRLTVAGRNPYDPSSIMELPYQVTRLPGMLNPPWTLPIVMVFGILSYPVSRMIWLLCNIALLFFAAAQLWKIYNGPDRYRWLAWVLTFTFTPVIAALQKGQFTPLVLLGLVGFMSVIDQINDHPRQRFTQWRLQLFIGCMIALIAIKPQLLYLFWLALFLWCLQHRNWLIIVSGGLVLAICTALPMIFDHNVITQYFQNMADFPLSEWATPTIGSYLRGIFGLEKFWLQFIPPLLGCLWFLYYWYPRRKEWHWNTEMPLLLLVSLLTNPYSWTYDLILVVPAIIFATVSLLPRFLHRPIKLEDIIIIVSYLVVDLLNIILHTRLTEFWFGWLTPVLIILYLIVRRHQPAVKNLLIE